MVSTAMHYVFGLMILKVFFPKTKKIYKNGIWAIAPDFDAIIFMLVMAGQWIFKYSLSFMENNQVWMDLLSHRGISHSVILYAVALIIAFFIKKQYVPLIASLWGSHLILDTVTAWKLFPFLPFSHAYFYIGLVEVFDSMLVLLTSIAFAIIMGQSIIKKEKKSKLVAVFLFFIAFGFFPAIFMGEYSLSAIIITNVVFFSILIYYIKLRKTKKNNDHATKMVKNLLIASIAYLVLLLGNQFIYASILDTSIQDIEPLEEFAVNFNAHTFEIDNGVTYDTGIISLKGIEERREVPKLIRDPNKVSMQTMDQFLETYEKAIHVNWFNNPVFTFDVDDQGITYANIRYAKTFLDNPHMPGPNNGLNMTVKNNMMVGYGDNWFD